MNGQMPDKKKFFLMMQGVKDFMRSQPEEVKRELNCIIWKLETGNRGIFIDAVRRETVRRKSFCHTCNAGGEHSYLLRLWSQGLCFLASRICQENAGDSGKGIEAGA